MEYFLGAFKKYAEFEGRARRKEYWMFYLFYIIAIFVLAIIDNILGTGALLTIIFIFGSFVPYIALSARRLHDTDRSGWWQLIVFIPIIGPLVMLFFTVLKGTEGENSFGSDPLAGISE